jgi:hypothetical protein
MATPVPTPASAPTVPAPAARPTLSQAPSVLTATQAAAYPTIDASAQPAAAFPGIPSLLQGIASGLLAPAAPAPYAPAVVSTVPSVPITTVMPAASMPVPAASQTPGSTPRQVEIGEALKLIQNDLTIAIDLTGRDADRDSKYPSILDMAHDQVNAALISSSSPEPKLRQEQLHRALESEAGEIKDIQSEKMSAMGGAMSCLKQLRMFRSKDDPYIKRENLAWVIEWKNQCPFGSGGGCIVMTKLRFDGKAHYDTEPPMYCANVAGGSPLTQDAAIRLFQRQTLGGRGRGIWRPYTTPLLPSMELMKFINDGSMERNRALEMLYLLQRASPLELFRLDLSSLVTSLCDLLRSGSLLPSEVLKLDHLQLMIDANIDLKTLLQEAIDEQETVDPDQKNKAIAKTISETVSGIQAAIPTIKALSQIGVPLHRAATAEFKKDGKDAATQPLVGAAIDVLKPAKDAAIQKLTQSLVGVLEAAKHRERDSKNYVRVFSYFVADAKARLDSQPLNHAREFALQAISKEADDIQQLADRASRHVEIATALQSIIEVLKSALEAGANFTLESGHGMFNWSCGINYKKLNIELKKLVASEAPHTARDQLLSIETCNENISDILSNSGRVKPETLSETLIKLAYSGIGLISSLLSPSAYSAS